jgi:hypothetical protein
MERLSESERRELWDRWEDGESQRSIARALGRAPATVRTRLLSSGWKRPVTAFEWCTAHAIDAAEQRDVLSCRYELPASCCWPDSEPETARILSEPAEQFVTSMALTIRNKAHGSAFGGSGADVWFFPIEEAHTFQQGERDSRVSII